MDWFSRVLLDYVCVGVVCCLRDGADFCLVWGLYLLRIFLLWNHGCRVLCLLVAFGFGMLVAAGACGFCSDCLAVYLDLLC